MKKLGILFAAVICTLLSVTVSAEDCPPLPLKVVINYNQSQPLPDNICIFVIWDFGNGCTFKQQEQFEVPLIHPPTGTFSIPFSFSGPFPCPGLDTICMTENNVVSLTVIVTDCEGGFENTEGPTDGWQPIIDIDYF